MSWIDFCFTKLSFTHDSSTILPWENVTKEIIILYHAGSPIAQP